MKKLRDIIVIDEELCNGCGQCILDCAEGALAIVDGKAKLVGEFLCDGLGACLTGCPTGALTLVRREADAYDEDAVEKRLSNTHEKESPLPAINGCGGQQPMELKPMPRATDKKAEYESGLDHWPIKLQLLPSSAPFLQGADLVLVADCAAAAMPDFHQNFLPGKAIALACPKLDDAQAHQDKLAMLLEQSQPKSLTVLRMEVPCCRGLEFIATEAVQKAGLDLELQSLTLGRDGKVQCAEKIKPATANHRTLF